MNSNTMIPFEKEKQELDYFRALVMIASKSGQYKDMNTEMMLNIMLTARDLGISPMKALNGGFYIVNGKISMSTTMMADRIRKEGHSIKIPEWTKEKCVIIGQRRDNEDSVRVEFTLEDAQLAGLLASPTWKRYPKSMLYNRAMSMLARVLFPDVVGNCYSEEEKYDILNIEPKHRPMEDPDQNINLIAIETVPMDKKENESRIDFLRQIVESESLDASKIKEFLEYRASKSDKPFEVVLESALISPENTKKFVFAYKDWLKSL